MAKATIKKTLDGPCGVQLHLDSNQVFPDDPGNGTPALVEYRGSFGTYWCCCDTGECDGIRLPAKAMKWLDSDEVSNAVLEIERFYD